MISIEQLFIVTAVLLLLGVFASKASSKLGVPSLLLFLGIGMLAGSEGPGGIPLDNPWLAQLVGVLALAFILFAGGLDTDWPEVSKVFWQGVSLATVGVAITALLVAVFARYLLAVPWLECFLLGSIVSSTDAAAVFSVLRSQGILLKGNIQPLLELESGSNDPMAAFLTIGLTHVLTHPGSGAPYLLGLFLRQMLIGAVSGYIVGRCGVWLMNRLKLDAEGLYFALSVAIVLLTYGATAELGGSGFLAVYLTGVVMGNREFVHRRTLTRFHDGLGWLMQIVVFLVLGLLVFPSHLWPVAGVSILLTCMLVFVARPVSVFVSLAFAKVDIRQKTLLSWIGLRGAVPIVLATFPKLAGVPHADFFFDVVFFVVLVSVLLQGATIGWISKALGLKVPRPPGDSRFPSEYLPPGVSPSKPATLQIPEHSQAGGQPLVRLGLPRSAHVMLVTRGVRHLVPSGSTKLLPGDDLFVLADDEDLNRIRSKLDARKTD